jgi:hypothetical protein
MSTVNMAWPAGIGKTALPEGRGLARSRSKGQSSDEILARRKHMELAWRR